MKDILLKGSVDEFSLDHNAIKLKKILNIHNYYGLI